MKKRHTIAGCVVWLAFGVIWWAVAQMDLISRLFIPAPSEVVKAFFEEWLSAAGLRDVGITIARLTYACIPSVAIGGALGLCLGTLPRVERLFTPYVHFARSLPSTMLLPLFVWITGVGETSKVLLVAWAAGLVMVVSTYYCTISVPAGLKVLATMYRVSWTQRICLFYIPAALPELLTGVRLALARGLAILVVSEMLLGSRGGIGARLYDAHIEYRTASLVSGILLTGAFGLLIGASIDFARRRFVHWRAFRDIP